jgi:hypothetical protein
VVDRLPFAAWGKETLVDFLLDKPVKQQRSFSRQ